VNVGVIEVQNVRKFLSNWASAIKYELSFQDQN